MESLIFDIKILCDEYVNGGAVTEEQVLNMIALVMIPYLNEHKEYNR